MKKNNFKPNLLDSTLAWLWQINFRPQEIRLMTNQALKLHKIFLKNQNQQKQKKNVFNSTWRTFWLDTSWRRAPKWFFWKSFPAWFIASTHKTIRDRLIRSISHRCASFSSATIRRKKSLSPHSTSDIPIWHRRLISIIKIKKKISKNRNRTHVKAKKDERWVLYRSVEHPLRKTSWKTLHNSKKANNEPDSHRSILKDPKNRLPSTSSRRTRRGNKMEPSHEVF